MNRALGNLCPHRSKTGPGEPPEDGEMNEMTVLQTQDSKFEPWRSEAEHTTSRSRRLPTILSFTRGWGRNIFVSFKPPRPGKAAVLTTTLGPPPAGCRASHVALVVALVCGQSCNFRVSRRVTRHVPNRADVRVGVFCT